MKMTTREQHWVRVLIVLCATMPMLVLFSRTGQWIAAAGVWFLLALAIGNGLLWLGLAVALAAVNRASTVGLTPVPMRKASSTQTLKLLLLLAAPLIGIGSARADQAAEDHAAHHPKQEAKAPAAPTTRPAETVEEMRAKIARLEAQLKEKSGGMGMGMMMGNKEGGGMGMMGMGMMGGMSGKDSSQAGGKCCCEMMGTMKDQQPKAPTTQPQHSHDHK